MVNPKVLEMLEKLDIDPLGVSVDSLMIIAPEDVALQVENVISRAGVKIQEIGYVDSTGVSKLIKETGEEELKPLFREAAYTKIKKIVGDVEPEDFNVMKEKVQNAALDAIKKKEKIVKTIQER
jgi:hydrogenase expression/formation protein